ncbi:MAG: histidine phosphatase family protein [Marinobacter sp.]|uniref:histidine phosphatase family protein n=1 Tax=Marinobacter sp. TaxID=50741 RepID=UPI00299EB683|nr:histidine phosphatase family protein [Marinobacter sp.]MDX1635572.1 histidine phosphatase family protein [Marinobacter sp.]
MATDNRTTLVDLIRHGEPEGGPMFRGSKDDPLSARGWAQMQAAIKADEQWDAVLSSPLQRCHVFATDLAGRLDLPLYQDDRLREISFGDWEGLTAEGIGERYGPDALSRFWADAGRYPPPGGEPFADFQARVQAAWQDWTSRLAGQRVLLVCHGGVIRVVLGHVMGIRQDRVLSAMTVPYACRSRVRLDHSDHGTLSCLESHRS